MGRAFGSASVAAVLLAAASAARAADLRVPGDFPDIPQAVNAARPGDRILLGAKTFRGPYTIQKDGIEIVGSRGTRILGWRPSRTDERGMLALVVEGDGVVLRGITFERMGVTVSGDGATVEGCVFRRIEATSWRPSALYVVGDGAVVTGNRLIRPDRDPAGMQVHGDRPVVAGNSIAVSRGATGLFVNGAGARVEDNDVSTRGWASGIRMFTRGGTVSSNRVRGSNLVVSGDDNVVDGNDVGGAGLGQASIRVEGDGNALLGNGVVGGDDTAFLVMGDGNLVAGNAATGIGSIVRDAGVGHGFVARGSDNVLERDVVDGCAGEAFRIAGNDAWRAVRDPATAELQWTRVTLGPGISVTGCTGTGAGTCGLGNYTFETSVTDSTFSGNGMDVVDCGGFAVFEDNTWGTGGPGIEGTGIGEPSGDTFGFSMPGGD